MSWRLVTSLTHGLMGYGGLRAHEDPVTHARRLTAVMSHDEDGFTQALGDSVDMVASMPSPRYIKSHLTWDLLPEQMQTVRPKVVYVARNPKDMCVSYYHYCQLVHRLAGGFEEFAELFLQDKGEC